MCSTWCDVFGTLEKEDEWEKAARQHTLPLQPHLFPEKKERITLVHAVLALFTLFFWEANQTYRLDSACKPLAEHPCSTW